MSHTNKLLETATTHHQAGRFVDAERAYRKLLRLEAVNIDGLRLLGGLYLQTGQMPLALEYLERAVRLRPHDKEIVTNLGIALRALGRLEDALTQFDAALKLDTDYISALHNRGGLFQSMGRALDASQDFQHVLSLTPQNPIAHFNYGNILYVQGQLREAVAHYEHALKLKNDYLEAMINLGMVLSQMGQAEQSKQWLDIAQCWFEKVLKADPHNVVALNNVGNVLRQKGNPEEALLAYREAIRINPTYAQAVINMATSLRDLNRISEALEAGRLALKLMPESSDARINLGVFLQDVSEHEEAITHFDEALRLKPSSLDAKWNKALSLLSLGDYQNGWQLYETGLGIAHMRGDSLSAERRWRGESFVGKRLLLWAEQGLGDTLQFIRYAQMCKARGGKILVRCPQALQTLLANCASIDAVSDNFEQNDFDFHAPLMSLPFIFDTLLHTIPSSVPYLHVSEAARLRWKNKIFFRREFKVGLVWAGNPRKNQMNAHMIDRRRSMTLEALRPLFDVSGIQFYSLQMGAEAAQIEIYGLKDRIIDFTQEIKDFEDTAALIEQLDLVISVDTSVVHLAGSLGKAIWVMSRSDACWRWLQNRADSPWYPTARIFGQKTPGDWEQVVSSIRAELEKILEKDRNKLS
jgi:tetratricopeptide (TPR) repeat protein